MSWHERRILIAEALEDLAKLSRCVLAPPRTAISARADARPVASRKRPRAAASPGLLLFLAWKALGENRLSLLLLLLAVAVGVGFQIPNRANLAGFRDEMSCGRRCRAGSGTCACARASANDSTMSPTCWRASRGFRRSRQSSRFWFFRVRLKRADTLSSLASLGSTPLPANTPTGVEAPRSRPATAGAVCRSAGVSRFRAVRGGASGLLCAYRVL